MSAIFGCIHLDGRPVPAGYGESMAQAMRRWGPDGVATIYRGEAMMGFANLAITPESVHEALPMSDPQSGVMFCSAARLDNRDELCDLFGIPGNERPTLPDSQLVLHAWWR